MKAPMLLCMDKAGRRMRQVSGRLAACARPVEVSAGVVGLPVIDAGCVRSRR